MCEPGKPCPGAEGGLEGLVGNIAALIHTLADKSEPNPAGETPEEQRDLANAILFETTDHMVRFMKLVQDRQPELLDTDEARELHKDLMTTILYRVTQSKLDIKVVVMKPGEGPADAIKRMKAERAEQPSEAA